jgi:hypothetical protein
MKSFNLQADFSRVFWKDVAEEVRAVKPELYSIIENISPAKKFPLIKASYPFGCLIIDKGSISKIYCKNKAHEDLIKSELQYAKIPLGLLLDKSSEAFIQLDDRIVPLNLLNKGNFFGNFELMNTFAGVEIEPPWSVSAGLRSIFFLQKVSNNIGQQRLRKEFGVISSAPQNFNEQWQTFIEIANANHQNNWKTNVFFFTKNWFDRKLTDSPEWFKFREYIYLESWKQRHHLIEQPITSFLWRIFASAIQNRKLRIKPYILDTIKHLLLISQAISPAFRPIYDDCYAPLKIIRDAYYDFYKLNIIDYFPTIMGIGFLNDKNKFLYYSLNYPTLYEGHYEKGQYNFIVEQREVKLALDTLYRYVKLNKTVISANILSVMNRLNFDYFHRSQDNYDELLSSNGIIKDDKDFVEIGGRYNTNFCSNSPFFSGCIRISRKKDEQ